MSESASPSISTAVPNDVTVVNTPAPTTQDKGKAPAPASTHSEENDDTPSDGESPSCLITLLLSSGTRHPYKLDDKYLAKRNVKADLVPGTDKRDPFSISVYTLKELILREWREEWDAKPASPSSIRLIYFGKLLDDKEPLKQYSFSAENRNVVHMSVRPADVDDDHEPKHNGKSSTTPASSSESTRCCVIL